MSDAAIARHGWQRLTYEPALGAATLSTYRTMLDGFTPTAVASPAWGDWRRPPAPRLLARCPSHDLYHGELGCRLCEDALPGDTA